MKVEGKHEHFLFNGEFRKGYIASVMNPVPRNHGRVSTPSPPSPYMLWLACFTPVLGT